MKQTEIGLIPDDWEVKRLGETNHVETGSTPSTEDKFNYGNEYFFVSPLDLGIDKYILKTEKKLSKKGFSLCRSFPKGSILYTCIGSTIGKCGISDKELTSNQQINAIFPNEKINNEFLYYALQNRTEDIRSRAGQQAVPLINKSEFEETQIPLPPLPEQQRIAKALSDVDSLISTTEKLLQKKKNIKQGAMQNLLTGKKRLSGFAKSTNYKQSELGLIPEDWDVKTLSEIFEFKPNNTFTRDCLNDSKGEYQNVHYGDVLIKYSSILDCSKESIPFINEGINVKFSKYGIMEGDIIIADTAEDETVGKVVEIFNLGEKKIVSGLHTFLCRKITDDFAPKWLGYFMNQSIFHNQLLPFITGTKVSAISRTAIQKVKVLIPSKEEQTAIANVLSSMDKEIETLNTKLEKYRNLKTAMMQQLLTGKIRLVK